MRINLREMLCLPKPPDESRRATELRVINHP